MDSLLGFSRLFKLLVELQKPIVGHNFLMDLMIMYSQFHEQLPSKFSLYYHCYDLHYKTLPYSNNNNLCISAQLSDFKEKIHRMFPVIYDTKYLSFEIKKIMKREGKILCNILCWISPVNVIPFIVNRELHSSKPLAQTKHFGWTLTNHNFMWLWWKFPHWKLCRRKLSFVTI